MDTPPPAINSLIAMLLWEVATIGVLGSLPMELIEGVKEPMPSLSLGMFQVFHIVMISTFAVGSSLSALDGTMSALSF